MSCLHRRHLVSMVSWIVALCAMILHTPVDGACRSPESRRTTGEEFSTGRPTVVITLGKATVRAVVANTRATLIEGLLKWNTITDEQGMLLDFGRPGTYAIHMQGMNFPIDAVWMDEQGAIKHIYENIQPDSGITYPALSPCRYCLELKAGFCKRHGVKKGRTARFHGTAGR